MKCSQICAGELRTLIIIEQENPTNDGYGGQTVTFTKISNTFAKVVSKRGFEDFKSQARRAFNRYEMTMRFSPAVDTKMRVSWKGKVGNITDIDNLEERDMWLVLTVEENIGE